MNHKNRLSPSPQLVADWVSFLGIPAGIMLAQTALRLTPWWSPFLVPLHMVAGWCLAVASCIFVNLSFAASRVLLDLQGMLRWLRGRPDYAHAQARGVVVEEVLWRALPTYLLIDRLNAPVVSLLAVAAIFTAAHLRRGQTIYIWDMLELFAFACVVTFTYFATRDLLAVFTLHLGRNLLSSYIIFRQHRDTGACLCAAQTSRG